jgi:hypothetical protein
VKCPAAFAGGVVQKLFEAKDFCLSCSTCAGHIAGLHGAVRAVGIVTIGVGAFVALAILTMLAIAAALLVI